MAPRDDLGPQSHPAVAAAVAALTPSTEALAGLVRAFRSAMADGLAGRPSSLKMLPTFVEQPAGDERGRVVVVDWGGTNGRVSVVELGGGDARVVAEDDSPSSEADRTGPRQPGIRPDRRRGRARRAGRVGAAAARPRLLLPRASRAGRSRSRPAAHEGLEDDRPRGTGRGRAPAGGARAPRARPDHGRGGGQRHGGGADPPELSDPGAIRCRDARRGGPHPRHGDEPGRGSARRRHPESRVGQFRWCGGGGHAWDRALDRELADPAPGAQRFEKMAAGALSRRDPAPSCRRSRPIDAVVPVGGEREDTPWSLDTVHLSAVADDESEGLSRTETSFDAGCGQHARGAAGDPRARARGGRARRPTRRRRPLGTLTFIDPDLHGEHTVAVDGGVYGGYPGFAGRVRDGVRELAGAERAGRVRLAYVKDSTSAGAAVIAAVAARRQP